MEQLLGNLRTVDEWERVEGASSPLGATWVESEQAWNFALYSRTASTVTLLLYAPADVAHPVLELQLDPLVNKTGRIWHCLVRSAEAPGVTYYAYRVDGPAEPRNRFLPAKVLFDPYAVRLCFPPGFFREAARGAAPNDGAAVLGVLPTSEWGSESVPAPGPRHAHDLVVYEVHVRGFTARANSGVASARRGTFRGLIDRIDHLKELGVTVVELLPVQQHDPQEGNYWGYMTMSFFAPHAQYAQDDPVAEFREMVDVLHAAGIEVWLDVVYNHTAESGVGGPTYNLRGIDNDSYYLVGPDGQYIDDSGCGNTTQAADLATRAVVLRSLGHWVEQFGVDGFRFDLASILTRDEDGAITQEAPPLVNEIGAFAASHDVRLVAEAWDIGAYLLGRVFPGIMWKQWNGRFRDDVRSFVRGDDGLVPALMTRVYGSDDLFPDGPTDMYRPHQSINFVTAHDGFCLYDLVSYNERHNEANGHGGTDGFPDNRSWNCGWEGDDGVPEDVRALRTRQMKNFAAILMLSNGVPMFVAGDEFGNTQGGNNNPYNQDNETTWLDWSLKETNRDLFEFFKGMIALRRSRRSIGRSRYWRGDVKWFGTSGEPDTALWSHSIAWWLSGAAHHEGDLYVMVNAHLEPLDFKVQAPGQWRRIVDTARSAPEHVLTVEQAPLSGATVPVSARSIVVLST
ncbi:MAG: isoamylase [Candidatus Nanopelagicales bacterium]